MKYKRLLIIALTTAILTFLFRIFLFGFYVIPTASMVPTLLTGDYVVVSKFAYGYGGVGSFNGYLNTHGTRVGGTPPKRGDIVVFHATTTDGPRVLLKRLIGLPGDKIQMIHDQLYLNMLPVPRGQLPETVAFPGDGEESADYVDYIEHLPDGGPHLIRMVRGEEDYELGNTAELTVPPHSYFVMGDNRDRSDDSRIANVGMVPEENIIGKGLVTFFSYANQASIWDVSQWGWAMRWKRFFITLR